MKLAICEDEREYPLSRQYPQEKRQWAGGPRKTGHGQVIFHHVPTILRIVVDCVKCSGNVKSYPVTIRSIMLSVHRRRAFVSARQPCLSPKGGEDAMHTLRTFPVRHRPIVEIGQYPQIELLHMAYLTIIELVGQVVQQARAPF